jgi:hypothetical protein
MVIRTDNGKFVTARQIPKMALVSFLFFEMESPLAHFTLITCFQVVPSLPPEALTSDSNALDPASVMVVDAPDMPSLEISLVRDIDPAGPLRLLQLQQLVLNASSLLKYTLTRTEHVIGFTQCLNSFSMILFTFILKVSRLRLNLLLTVMLHVIIRTVTVWEWSGLAADEGDGAADWFSKFLGIPCRLARCVF